MGSHKGTGYQSNFRPVVSYQAKVDTLEPPGPAMGYGQPHPFSPPVLLELALRAIGAHRTTSRLQA